MPGILAFTTAIRSVTLAELPDNVVAMSLTHFPGPKEKKKSEILQLKVAIYVMIVVDP